jgi:predicted permease
LRGKLLAVNFLQDLRFGFRVIRRSPLLSCTIVVTLALGIGLDTAAFTILNALGYKAWVEKDPDSFVELLSEYSGESVSRGDPWTTSVEDYREYQAGAHSLSSLAAWQGIGATLNDDPEPISPLLVTCNFFSVYGLEHAKLGRLFFPDECATPGGASVVVISEEVWQRRFATDPHIIGMTISLNHHLFTVVGIAPARFSGSLFSGVWVPWTVQPLFSGQDLFHHSSEPWLIVEGRLKTGYSRAAVRAEVSVIARRQDRLHPGRRTTLFVTNGSQSERPDARGLGWFVVLWMSTVTLVLLIACTNVTTLLLSRAASRRREIAIRLSLGAGRARLIRMLFNESLILTAAASGISVYLAYHVPEILSLLAPDLPYIPMKPDLTVFGFLAGVTLVVTIITGLAPAASSWKTNLVASVNGQEDPITFGSRRWNARDFLITAQIAMSLVLLIATASVMRVQYNLLTGDSEFETRQLLVAPLNVDAPRYTADSAWKFYQAVVQNVRALPGVRSVCYASPSFSPFWGWSSQKIRMPGQAKGAEVDVSANAVSLDFFETVRLPVVRGRAFRETDIPRSGLASVILVSQTFARTFWPSADPIGKAIEDVNGRRLEVIGVTRDIRTSAIRVDGPHFYGLQTPSDFAGQLMVRFVGAAQPLERAIRELIRGMDPEQFGVPRTLRWEIEQKASKFWFFVELLLVLGGTAILLAVTGIYAVAAFAVNRCIKEFGIRMALGATKGDIFQFVLTSGVRPIATGLITGLLMTLTLSFSITHVLGALPGELALRDPIIYVVVTPLLGAAAIVAMFGPAFRAAGSDPATSLRHD